MAVLFNPTYAHMNSNATNVIKRSPGNLASVTINTKGATSNLLTLYDGLDSSGTVIAVIDTTANVGFVDFAGLVFQIGLTAILAAGTAADVTVVYA